MPLPRDPDVESGFVGSGTSGISSLRGCGDMGMCISFHALVPYPPRALLRYGMLVRVCCATIAHGMRVRMQV